MGRVIEGPWQDMFDETRHTLDGKLKLKFKFKFKWEVEERKRKKSERRGYLCPSSPGLNPKEK